MPKHTKKQAIGYPPVFLTFSVRLNFKRDAVVRGDQGTVLSITTAILTST